MSKVELLAPAGNMEGFYGALNAGCDAVYLGGQKFGARAYAENFSPEELKEAIHTAHLFGAKVYLTANILLRQEELSDAVSEISKLYEEGLDGVIIQDLGLIRALGAACPGLLLHASTQLSVTTAEAAEYLRRLGVSRVVPARELSLPEMKKIRDTGMEVEAFIHGSMCYSYSGRCLMSSFLGGRSGNRGRCAGTCRLPFCILDSKGRPQTKREAYPLSMKDMCTLSILPELIEAGIDSFKIEGRMKKPEYAAGTVAIYRKYIDRCYEWARKGKPGKWTVDEDDLKDLLSLYIRTDLSEGYYHKRNGRDLITMEKPGYAGADEALLQGIREQYLEKKPKLPVSGAAEFVSGKNAKLTVSASIIAGKEAAVSAEGPVVSRAEKAPMKEALLREKLEKTGDFPFYFQSLSVVTDNKCFLPVSAVNGLRRDALSALTEKLQGQERKARHFDVQELSPKEIRGEAPRQKVFILVTRKEQLSPALEYGDAVILDGELADALARGDDAPTKKEGQIILTALPYIFRESDRAYMNRLFAAGASKTDGFFARSIEEIEFIREKGYSDTVIADSPVYHWNRAAASVLYEDCSMLTLPLELAGREMEDTFFSSYSREILPVYGYIPLMMSAGCIRKTAGRCTGKEDGIWYLKDRKGIRFPVRTICSHCQNIIYNSVPYSLQKCMKEDAVKRAGGILFSFTLESGEKAAEVLHLFSGFPSQSKRAQGEESHTFGHYRKGAI